jgi:hypothetical protein
MAPKLASATIFDHRSDGVAVSVPLNPLLLALDPDPTFCDARAFSPAEDEYPSARYVRYTGYRIL